MSDKLEPPVRSNEQYEIDKIAGVNSIGRPAKEVPPLSPDAPRRDPPYPPLTRDTKPLFSEKRRPDDDYVLPPLPPRNWIDNPPTPEEIDAITRALSGDRDET